MGKLELKDIFSVKNDYDVFLFDIWGVIVEGQYTYEGVVENINKLIEDNSKKIFFVSNAPRTRLSLLAMINSWGINATYDMVISSGEVAKDFINNSKKYFNIDSPLVYHLHFDENDLIDHIDCRHTKNILEANILLLTLYIDEHSELDLDKFDDILKYAAENNIINLCANPDIDIVQRGVRRYCAGYFAKKIEQFGGKVIYTGKPEIEIYNKVLESLVNYDLKRILMIGDTFYTDISGANKLGIDSALVMTGNAEKYHIKYKNIEDKLTNLKITATENLVMPSFIIKI